VAKCCLVTVGCRRHLKRDVPRRSILPVFENILSGISSVRQAIVKQAANYRAKFGPMAPRPAGFYGNWQARPANFFFNNVG
jgi:hypothetical protein